MEHTIQLVWKRGEEDPITVKHDILNLQIGDIVSFKSNQGKAFVVFPNGSPFSSKAFEIFTDLDHPTVQRKSKPCRFLCGLVVGDKRLHTLGGGGDTPESGEGIR